MVGAIVQGSLQADHGVTSQGALLDCFLQTLFNSGVEVLGNSAANDSHVEDQIVLLFLGLEANPNVTELAGTAGLLLVTAVSFDLLLDLLAVSNLCGGQDSVDAEAGLQLSNDDIQLLIAGAGDNQLMGFSVVDDGEGGIFLVQTVQTGADLFFLTTGLGSDCPPCWSLSVL